MKKIAECPVGRQNDRALSALEEGDIQRCDFSGLILEEELMIKGAGQILNEFGCSPDDEGGDAAEIEVPALALWMLGKVVMDSANALLHKLELARERLQSVGVPEVLEARLTTKGNESSRPVSAKSRRPAEGARQQSAAA